MVLLYNQTCKVAMCGIGEPSAILNNDFRFHKHVSHEYNIRTIFPVIVGYHNILLRV